MAFDADHDRVFIAGRKPAQLICLDSKTGAVVSHAPCVAVPAMTFITTRQQIVCW